MQFDTSLPIWVIRAGEGAAHVEAFEKENVVAIGWAEVGQLAAELTDEEIDARFVKAYPDRKAGTVRVWANQVKRFLREPRIGNPVATYDRERRRYLIGIIAGPPKWRDGDLPRWRPVEWLREVPRDILSASTRNSLGSIATLFRLPEEVTRELWDKAIPHWSSAQGAPLVATPAPALEEQEEEALEIQDNEEKARQFIEDRLSRLDWKEMQELVAAILRAMGYKARVSDDGPDRGVDIFASPDGLGLQEPRIFVEVKHRSAQMGSQEIRAFLGGRKPGDRCLYVSTAGFSKDARYEAERASVPIRLLTMTDLRELLMEHYENLSTEAKRRVPLRRGYWPVE
jgi:restriction system protein